MAFCLFADDTMFYVEPDAWSHAALTPLVETLLFYFSAFLFSPLTSFNCANTSHEGLTSDLWPHPHPCLSVHTTCTPPQTWAGVVSAHSTKENLYIPQKPQSRVCVQSQNRKLALQETTSADQLINPAAQANWLIQMSCDQQKEKKLLQLLSKFNTHSFIWSLTTRRVVTKRHTGTETMLNARLKARTDRSVVFN